MTTAVTRTNLWQHIPRVTTLGIDFVLYATVRVLISVLQTLPTDMGDRLCYGLAWIATGPLKIRRAITKQNLDQIFPDASERDRERLAFAMWHHLLLMVCEIAWAQRRLHLTNWSQYIVFRENRQTLRHLLSRRPKVTVTGTLWQFRSGGLPDRPHGLQHPHHRQKT